MNTLRHIAAWLRRYLAPVPGAVRKRLNWPEVTRVLVLASVAGGGIAPSLALVTANLPTLLPGVDPSWVAALGAILTALAEAARRYTQGEDPDHAHAE